MHFCNYYYLTFYYILLENLFRQYNLTFHLILNLTITFHIFNHFYYNVITDKSKVEDLKLNWKYELNGRINPRFLNYFNI